MKDGSGHALREIVGRLRAHGAHRQAEQGQFAAAAVEVLRARREGVLAVARRDHLVRRSYQGRPHVLADGAGVHVVRARLRNRLLLHVAPREAVEQSGEPGAAGVRHFQHDDARRVRCDHIFIIFRRLIDRAARGAARGFVDGYGAHD